VIFDYITNKVLCIVYLISLLFLYNRYNQVCSPTYVFDVDRPQEGSDQFKQIVWKETNKLGIARSTFEKQGNHCTIIVARYSPPVSRADVRSNVPRGSFDVSYCGGLGKSSDFIRESGHSRSAIQHESSNTQGMFDL
jgi:hypothetical protein